MKNIYEQKDKELKVKIKCTNYHSKHFCGGGIVTQLIWSSDKIVKPMILQK